MRTEELKRLLYEDLGEFYYENDDVIHGVFWDVWEKQQRLVVRGVIQEGVLTTLVKYHNTPISEREDEKKYRIELAEICEGVLTKDEMRSNETKIIFNTIFTQKQIDHFPKEIKGAIECGFLRKVEVE